MFGTEQWWSFLGRKVGLQHVLGHHFFWSTLERISFVVDFSNHIDEVGVKAAISRSIEKKIKQNKVFENRWDSNYLPDRLVKAMDEIASNLGLPAYIYTDWISLLRFMKNAFNHYNSIPENIRDEIASSKGALETLFRTSFPGLMTILFNEGQQHGRTMYNFSINILDNMVYRASGNNLTEDSSTPIPSEFFKDQRCPHFSSCSDSATKDQDLKETLSVQLGSLVGNAKLNAKLNDVDLL
ncbi:serine/threonine-protein kinase/endoribonuclease IRE1a-like protein isoform X2 [Tanacetum coccineum]